MKVYPECYNCFITQAIRSSKLHTSDKKKILSVVEGVVNKLTNIDHTLPPPIISEEVYKTIREKLGVDDPYKEIKRKYNDIAKSYDKFAKAKIKNSDDALFCSLKLSLAGNIIDFGGEMDKFSIEETINDTVASGFHINDMDKFKAKLQIAKNLVLLADNAGEIVFDKILLETIKDIYPGLNLYVFVRGGAIINDVTIEDANYVKINSVAKVIKTQKAIPGFWPNFCDKECKDIWANADIIISKGQGNFETLSEISDARIFFLFIIKCKVVAEFLNLKKFSKIFLQNRF
jgi:uncharacterized protein with ATP-grasp and redox domains